jgi:putative ABC transport system permease protein
MTLFTTFGTFSISAGVLLIFLIFVMLAAERRGEMGIARAIGTQRRHLVESFLFEGVAYDVVAAAIGAVLGLGVAFGMVAVMARAFGGGTGLDIRYSVSTRSIVIGFGLGLLLTLIVVTVSAWRVSVLNICSAIRNLPDPSSRRKRARWLRGVVGVGLGVVLTVSGVSAGQATPTLLGASIVLVSAVPIARALGVGDRLAYTTAGLALVVFWLLPFSVVNWIFGTLRMDFSVWIVGGLLVVLGLTWTIMYNADVLLAGVTRTFGHVRRLAPVLKISVAYPLRNRFRTGVTLAMFTLVVFTLVVGAVTTESFTSAFNDTRAYGGGFDVLASVSPASPIGDIKATLAGTPGLDPSVFEVAASESMVGVDARQAGTDRAFTSYPLHGLDDTFLTSTTYSFAALGDGYSTGPDVWHALQRNPDLAVVDALVVPRQSNFNFGARPDFTLSGFFLEDKHFAPIPVEIRDPQTGDTRTLTIIGVLKDSSLFTMSGISVSQRALAPFGERARPFGYRFRLAAGTDHVATARALESAFLSYGMKADATEDLVHDAVAANLTINRLVLGFIGLGLVVGVAALGVISARSVVERRQQIGVLRAIGFQGSMVQSGFLIEALFIALTAIVGGSVLGLVMGYNIVADSGRQPNWDTLSFTVPWLTLIVIFTAVLVTALAATYFPARRGSHTYPAAALRYQ